MAAKSLLRSIALGGLMMGSLLGRPAEAGFPIPDPAQSTFPSHILLMGHQSGPGDPAGEFCITVRSYTGEALANSAARLDLSGCPGVRLCADQFDPNLIWIRCSPPAVAKVSNAFGTVCFRLIGSTTVSPGGSCPPMHCLQLSVDGVQFPSVSVATPDLDGVGGLSPADLALWLEFFFNGSNCSLADFDGSGDLGPADLSEWLDLYFAGGSTASCGGPYCP